MSSFINKSTKRVAPKLPGLRRRPAVGSPAHPTPEVSNRSSLDPRSSPAPDTSQSTPQLVPVPADAPPTPPSTQANLSEPNGEPPSKRRKTAESDGEDARDSGRATVQDTRQSRPSESTESASESNQLTPDESNSASTTLQNQLLDDSNSIRVNDLATANGLHTSEHQRHLASPQARENNNGVHGRGVLSRAKAPVPAGSEPSTIPTSPPLGGRLMGTVESGEEPTTQPKQRKVRKDKGTKRRKQPLASESDAQDSVAASQDSASGSAGPAAGPHGISSTERAGSREANASQNPSGLRQRSATAAPIASVGRGSRTPKYRAGTDRSSLARITSIGFTATPGATLLARTRQRRETPPENERVEILPSVTTMHDLCRDTRTGQTSSKERRLQARDRAESVRRQQVAEGRVRSSRSVVQSDTDRQATASPDIPREDGTEGPSHDVTNGEGDGQENLHQGPTLRLVDGVIQLDEDSLQVDRHATRNGDAEDATAAIEEDELSQRLTTQTWLYVNRRDPADRNPRSHRCEPWDQDQTRFFYEALRMFGTDFGIISAMFPGRSRRQIKAKFQREERENPELVDEALRVDGRVPMSLEQYAQATGREVGEGDDDGEEGGGGNGFVDPVKLKEELAREEEEARKQIEEVRKEADEERRQREAAKLHRDGEGKDGAEIDKDNPGAKKRKNKGKRRDETKLGKKKRRKLAVVAGGEEVVVPSIE
ncbi:MAG: Transcription factor TFIIIB component B [Bathelium mastoideum]|nr:MAG: Transcription factor TFIIIB component B [Bathelium mastoideum]